MSIERPSSSFDLKKHWKEYPQSEIIPPLRRSLIGRLAHINNEYSAGLTPVEQAQVLALVGGAHLLYKLNRTAAVQWLREKTGHSLPAVSDVIEERGGKNERVEGTSWMMYLTKVRREKRAIPFYLEDRFNVDDPQFMISLVATLLSSGVTANNETSFNTFLHAVHNPNSEARIPYEDPPCQAKDLMTSVAIVNRNGSAQVVSVSAELGIWRSVEEQLANPPPEALYGSVSELYNQSLYQPVHAVIDCSGLATNYDIPAYCLLPTSHTGVSVNQDPEDPMYGQLVFACDHLPVDGTLLTEILLQVPRALQKKFNIGKLPFESVPIVGTKGNNRIEFLSTPTSQRQTVGINGLPTLPFAPRIVAALSAEQRYRKSRNVTSEIDRKDAVRRVSATAALGFPEPFTGDKSRDYHAQRLNRISVFHTDTVHHATTIETLSAIGAELRQQYGNRYLEQLLSDESAAIAMLKTVSVGLKQQFVYGMRRSFGIIQNRVGLARKNEGAIELAETFYGKYMPQSIADTAERMMSPAVRAQLHGHIVITNIDINTMLSGAEALGWFTSVAAMGEEVQGQSVLATLNAKAITPRHHFIRTTLRNVRSIITSTEDDSQVHTLLHQANLALPPGMSLSFVRELLKSDRKPESIFALLEYNQLIPPELLLESSASTLSYVGETSNPREEVLSLSAMLYHDWQLMHALLKNVYRPSMRRDDV